MDNSNLLNNVRYVAGAAFREYAEARLRVVQNSLDPKNIETMWPGDPTLQALHRGALQMELAQWERTIEISDYCRRRLEQ